MRWWPHPALLDALQHLCYSDWPANASALQKLPPNATNANPFTLFSLLFITTYLPTSSSSLTHITLHLQLLAVHPRHFYYFLLILILVHRTSGPPPGLALAYFLLFETDWGGPGSRRPSSTSQ
ncbi:hypothetical protein CRV24_000475 [Beauveria bassiana]|nr:hypothetical protein CRV24_000475 [Beauveria bassiana]